MTQTCPHCGALNLADALFCEACGYDFTTGTPPMGSEPVVEEPADEDDEGAVVEEPVDEQPVDEGDDKPVGEVDEEPADEDPAGPEDDRADPGVDDGEAPEADTAEDEAEDEDGDEPGEGPEVETSLDLDDEPAPEADEPPEVSAAGSAERPETPPEPDEEDEEDEAPAEPPLPPQPVTPAREAPPQRRPRHTPPSRELAQAWVVELWVDPDWYAVQQTAETIPSPGVPDIVLLTRSSALVGRPSGSLGARPDVDAGIDSAVSRRHAQLTSDGRRWWIEDLGSSNGTFVGTFGDPLPSTPITPGQRVELDRDDRIYVGAWTRLVLRPATDSEQHGTG